MKEHQCSVACICESLVSIHHSPQQLCFAVT